MSGSTEFGTESPPEPLRSCHRTGTEPALLAQQATDECSRQRCHQSILTSLSKKDKGHSGPAPGSLWVGSEAQRVGSGGLGVWLEHSRTLQDTQRFVNCRGRGAEVSTVKLAGFDQVLRLFTEETKEPPGWVSGCLCHLGSHTAAGGGTGKPE